MISLLLPIWVIGLILMLLVLVYGTVDFNANRNTIILAVLDSLVLSVIWPISLVFILYVTIQE